MSSFTTKRPHVDLNPLTHDDFLSRRQFLSQMEPGWVASPWHAFWREEASASVQSDWAPRQLQYPAKAKRIIQIFCPGAVSQLDTFDYKPELILRHGQAMPGQEKLVTFQGGNGALMKSPWGWKPAWTEWQVGFRPIAAPGRMCGRNGVYSFADRQEQYPWPCYAADEYRVHPRRVS